jgi:hypothetical protein
VRRFLPAALLVSLAVVGSASASHQDPQKRLTKADNTRARAMLLTRADLPGFKLQRSSGDDPHVECPAAVSETDLTLTGEDEGRAYESGPVFIGSSSQVYESQADADASWRRSTGAAGLVCMRAELRAVFEPEGTLKSLRKLAFPSLAQRRIAYRATISVKNPQGAVPLYIDLVGLAQGRAHVSMVVGAVFAVPQRAAVVRLARIVAGRMKTAMRGA